MMLLEKYSLQQKNGVVAFLQTLPQSWLEVDELQAQVVYDDTKGDLLGPISIGVGLTRDLEKPVSGNLNKPAAIHQQRVAIVGDSDFITNSFIGSGGNLDLAVQLFNWLSADDSLLGVKTNAAPDTVLELNDAVGMALALWFLLGLPILLTAWGVWIWIRRRSL